MASNNGNGRNEKPERRRGNKAGRRKRALLSLESLENRQLLAGLGDPPAWKPLNLDIVDIKNGPLANTDPALIGVYGEYQAFLKSGRLIDFFRSSNPYLQVRDGMVSVNVYGYGDTNALAQRLVAPDIGMIPNAVNTQFRIISGYLPIDKLEVAARLNFTWNGQAVQTVSIQPNYRPIAGSQGVANNQAEDVLRVTDARQLFPAINGSGVTVGILSDSVNRFQGGLNDSIATGDLPPLSRINVLLDEPVGGSNTDEGRAMLEHVYDLAPGSNLAFHTAFISDINFADGIRALSRVAGAQVIADDVLYANEPFYQVGPIEQAITDVVTQDNRLYFTLAHNWGDNAFESPFRSATATHAGVTGTFMDFDPGAGVVTTLPITVNTPGLFILQWDQPFYTSNGVLSDVDIFVLDANGGVVAQGVSNNLATQTPMELFAIPNAGNFTVAVFARTGPAPSRVYLRSFSSAQFGGITFSQQFGNAGGITYATVTGHNGGLHAITVGAVPFFNAPPYGNQNPLLSEPFSGLGPRRLIFDFQGNRLPQALVLQKPTVSSVDAANTTFFGTDIPQDPDNFPNFFGTSAATPNLAAVGALMRQLSPNVTQADVQAAMIASASPLNGAAQGQWHRQGGFGLVDAVRSLQAVDNLRVTTTTPVSGATLTSSITQITINFNKAINPNTLQASDLVFTQTPTGVTAVATGVTLLPNRTTAIFNIQVTRAPGAKANGNYRYQLGDGSISSTDNKPLVFFSGTFNVSDVISPTILGTDFIDRRILVQFSEAMDVNTINANNLKVVRRGTGTDWGQSGNVFINEIPGYRVQFFATLNGQTNVALIDLSDIPQFQLPSDRYALIVEDTVTDVVGNRLDGEFNGVFPTGDRKPLPGEDNDNDRFFQDLGFINLLAPNILFVELSAASDSGIPGDQNTNVKRPEFVGRVSASFPGAIAGLQVVVQFNSLHGNTLDLRRGANGRGFTVGSTIDFETTTDAEGRFSFRAPVDLVDGFHTVRVIVVGQPDSPPLPGFSALLDQSFRIDTTNPLLTPINISQNALINNLNDGIQISVTDPVRPDQLPNSLAVPLNFQVPALDPATATNISNYRLVNLGPDNIFGTADDVDFSNFITSAQYFDTTNRANPASPFTGRIELDFAAGLPAGRYRLIAQRPTGSQLGVTDAAGNAIDGDSVTPGAQDFILTFDLQPVPTFVTDIQLISPVPNNPTQTVVTGPRDFYEIPVPGVTPRAPAPPNVIYIDFSGPLDPNLDYTNRVQLIRSANAPAAPSDGDFGLDPTFSTGSGFTRVPGVTVRLINSVLGAEYGDPGFKNRLEVTIPAGTTLPADSYRINIPNAVVGGTDLRIRDLFGNHVDGEFLGNPTPTGGWETLLPTGQYRRGMTGDLVPGGALITSFIVAPIGNVLYVKPDYLDDPFLTSDDPDGSLERPFAALAPEALPNAANGGDLNSAANFGTGFNRNLDLNGNGRFDRSAFFAASQLSSRGPVVIVGLPGSPGDPQNRTFVLQRPNQADITKPTIPDGSASVPYNTTLVFQPGSILKMRDASLYIQNQGSAIQLRGGPNPNQQVYITSYLDDSVGGDTNRDGAPGPLGSGARPNPGDFGGIVLRNFDDTSAGGRPIPITPGPDEATRPQVDGRVQLGISGADDALSYFNFGQIRYGGGAVPQTVGFRFDAITLFNSRPSITNMQIDGRQIGTVTGPNGGSQGGISGDMDSFREDTLARGPLVRRTTVRNTSINGIYVRAELNGVIQPTNAIFYPSNPSSLGGQWNYTFDDPLPYVLVSRMVVGQRLLHNTGLSQTAITPRVYVQPGMMFKMQRGSAIELVNANSSINIGDRTYINQFDQSPNIAPTDAGFVPQKTGDARVVFTSFFDDDAFTEFVDPFTGARTRIVPQLDSDNGGAANQPRPNNVPPLARWGSILINSGSRAVIDEADFRYGGGTVNTPNGTLGARQVVSFRGAGGQSIFGTTFGANGTRAYVTNNNFFDNQDAAMGIEANGLLAADPLRPLQSGNPFFRGNVFERNDLNGVEVFGAPQNRDGLTVFGYPSNLDVESIWDDTDVPWILRTTIILAGAGPSINAFNFPRPPAALAGQLRPYMTLTLQSGLPDTLLADGSRIPRPGEELLVKLLNDLTVPPLGDGVDGMAGATPAEFRDTRGGAGFIVGIDDAEDGDPDVGTLVDPGALSQIRILGIPGNETTGQRRVPVIMTSLRDNSVGKTVRGVNMNQGITPAALAAFGYTGTAPQPGDGGIIAFGANSLSDGNLYDPRDGNIIDNADISFITRIEMQGGGFAYSINGDDGAFNADKAGANAAGHQYNTAKAMTISNSNLHGFSQVGVIAYPSGVNQIAVLLFPVDEFPPVNRDGEARGQAVFMYLVNNTLSNMPTGVRINSETVNNDNFPSPYMAVFQNNTFHDVGVGIHTEAPDFNGENSLSHVHFIAINNIFSNVSDTAVRTVGQARNSQLLYNLYSNVNNAFENLGTSFVRGPFNAQAIFGNPDFRDVANRDFALGPLSDAIDASISEIQQSNLGNMLRPITNQQLNSTVGIRNTTGRIATSGGLFNQSSPGDIITLPGFPRELRGYFDQWVPVVPNAPGAIPGFAGSNQFFLPFTGERDQQGFLRQDDPNRANVGFGSRPFFDVGANEYRELFPPQIIDVTATLTTSDPGQPIESTIYVVGGVGGMNQTPINIKIKLNQRIDPATVNSLTVLLQASGGDGLFENNNNSQDRFIPLSGKLSYDAATSTITIGLSALGLTLGSDLYRITVRGRGSEVLRNTVGLALDGENTVGADRNGAQLPLPSGDSIPGGDFFVTFSIDVNPPSIVPITLRLEPQNDARPNDNITNDNTPTFLGTITDVPPPLNPLVGQTVIVDVDVDGDGVFDILNAGTGITDANGNFSVTLAQPMPDTPYNVGPDGILGTADDSGYSIARVRIIDTNGNTSDPNDPNARISFVVDSKGPRVTGTAPLSGAQATVVNNTVQISLAINENVEPASLTNSSIVVSRSGGDGIFGNGNDVQLAIDVNSIQIDYLKTPAGAIVLRFRVTGVDANDVYRVVLRGDSTGVTDIAGNPIDGETTLGLPSGDGLPGGDFVLDFFVLDPTLTRTIFVSVNGRPNATGARFDPFNTITGGIAAAGLGDTVAVIGGTQSSPAITYRESINLKALVRVVSADTSSTDTNLVPGLALKTVISAPLSSQQVVTVRATNLSGLSGYPTELRGFTIASPLTNNAANGPILTNSIGIFLDNSDVLVSRNYIITSGMGILVQTSDFARAPQLESNVIVGNRIGLQLTDLNGSTDRFEGGRNTRITNNTFAYNDNGMIISTDAIGPVLADLTNNIFWQNAPRTILRDGVAIRASNHDRIRLRNNLFTANGPSVSSPADDTVNVGSGFNPALLSVSRPDALGNLTGNPAFVSALDPRPEGNGPGNFFLGANYDITSASAAIDNAAAGTAPATDFRFRGRVDIPGRGFEGFGPADIGAFEFNGTGGIGSGASTSGGSFGNPQIATFGLRLGAGVTTITAASNAIIVRFTGAINRASVQASDLLLSGDALNPFDPARAVSVSWIDNRTVRFNLEGQFLPTGKLQVDLAQGAIRNANNTLIPSVSQTINSPASTSTPIKVKVPKPTTPKRKVVAKPKPAPKPQPKVKFPFLNRLRK